MIRRDRRLRTPQERIPRESGDDPKIMPERQLNPAYSPRERG